MKLTALLTLAKKNRLRLMLAGQRIQEPINRGCFILGAARAGLLQRLSGAPVSLSELQADYPGTPDMEGALERFLEIGVKLGVVQHIVRGYRLRGFLARELAKPANDDILAFLEEILVLYHKFLIELPSRLKAGGAPFAMSDQDGVLIARSSRMIEPFLREGIDRVVPRTGPYHVLEVGCGSGTYMRHMRVRNLQLTALGYELQPEVAEAARKNLREWRVGSGISVEVGDIRDQDPTPEFDLVTLHNNIYYFRFEERVRLLRHVRGFLKPGGKILLTTGCQGGGVFLELLSMWGAATEGSDRLPYPHEQVEQLVEAGFEQVEATQLMPGEAFYAFSGTNLKH